MTDEAPVAGAVTFLFTDIEGSTRSWEEDPEGMLLVLARHDELLGEIVGASGGAVFKGTGDGICAVFSRPDDAVLAAGHIVEAMAAEPWPGPSIRSRVGVHTGTAAFRDGDWFGPALNRTARVMDAGHGGQVLISDATVALLATRPPLVDRGEHRLRDLSRPLHLWQLRTADGVDQSRPLRTLDARRHNLPSYATSFVGREEDLQAVIDDLDRARMISLIAAGGCGKTRLAVQAAALLVERFDTTTVVELALVDDPSRVASLVLDELGLADPLADATLDVDATLVAARVGASSRLIVLDNCEHVVDAVANLCQALLADCPDVRLLVTSREVIGIPGEQVRRVRSLFVPSEAVASADQVMACEAARLFLDRARAANADFRINDEDAPHLSEILRRLDGIPLALELAAARTRVMTVRQINERLDRAFRLLVGGPRTTLERHRTLEASIAWSFDHLEKDDQEALCALAVFAGGFSIDAAEEVLAAQDLDVLSAVPSLVDKSLVELGDDGRYRILEMIRQFALARLLASGRAEQARRAHFDWIAGLVGETPTHVMPAPARGRLEPELPNLIAAVDWASINDPDKAGRPVLASREIWFSSDRWQAAIDLIMRCFPPSATLTADGADLVATAANWSLIAGQVETGRQQLGRAQEAAPDSLTVAYVACRFDQWGGIPYAEVRDRLSGIVELAGSAGRTRDLLYGLGTLLLTACHAGQREHAAVAAERLRDLGRSIDLAADFALAHDLSFHYSPDLVEHVLRTTWAGEFFRHHYLLLGALGAADKRALGDAAEFLSRALRALRETDTLELVVSALDQSAGCCAASGRPKAAWRLWGCVDAYYEPRRLVARSDHPDYTLHAVRTAAPFDDSSYRRGRIMTVVDGVDLALEHLQPGDGHEAGRAG